MERKILLPESNRPPMGEAVRLNGQPIVFISRGDTVLITDDHPSCEGEHLLGSEGQYGAFYSYRDATDKEKEGLEQTEARVMKKKDRGRLIRRFVTEGEMPSPMVEIEGECLVNTPRLYGGGDWFVISDIYVWYFRNNSADGDNWDANNAASSGARGLGYRIIRDDALEEEIRNAFQ